MGPCRMPAKLAAATKSMETEMAVHRSTTRLSTLDFQLLTEQTGNVDENKGQGQEVEESRFDNSRRPRLVARNACQLLDYSTFDSRLLTEQTGNVDEKKGPSQGVKESRFDNSRSPRLVARNACQLLNCSTTRLLDFSTPASDNLSKTPPRP